MCCFLGKDVLFFFSWKLQLLLLKGQLVNKKFDSSIHGFHCALFSKQGRLANSIHIRVLWVVFDTLCASLCLNVTLRLSPTLLLIQLSVGFSSAVVVTLEPLIGAETYVNGKQITEAVILKQGARFLDFFTDCSHHLLDAEFRPLHLWQVIALSWARTTCSASTTPSKPGWRESAVLRLSSRGSQRTGTMPRGSFWRNKASTSN